MKKVILISTLLFFAFHASEILADRIDRNSEIASFIYSLPKMIDDGNGKFCVYGYDQIAVELKEQHKNLTFFKNDDNISSQIITSNGCKILYISKNKYSAIKPANEAKVLSIGTDENFVDKGGTIAVEMGRRSFELNINHKTIKELKIKLDPLLEGLIVN